MTPLPTISDVVRTSFIWADEFSARNAVNVMHFHIGGYNIDDLHDAIDSAVTGEMWQHARSQSHVKEIHYTPLDGGSGSVIKPVSGLKWEGQQGSTNQPIPQAAVLVKLTTAKRGRSKRGRVFLPWPTENICAAGVYDSANRAGSQSAWDDFGAAMSAAFAPLVVASYKHADFELVTGQKVEEFLGTVRKRQPRPA